MALQGFKILTFTNIQPGATAHGWWNNANSEVYRLNAWPKVAPGVAASAEITKISGLVHGNPSERELHFDVKNTGATTIDVDVWGLAWDWSLHGHARRGARGVRRPRGGRRHSHHAGDQGTGRVGDSQAWEHRCGRDRRSLAPRIGHESDDGDAARRPGAERHRRLGRDGGPGIPRMGSNDERHVQGRDVRAADGAQIGDSQRDLGGVHGTR